jgi:hypothetical protein
MYTAMEYFREGFRSYQHALRVKPFATLEQAMAHAKKRAKGQPFVCKGVTVVWVH